VEQREVTSTVIRPGRRNTGSPQPRGSESCLNNIYGVDIDPQAVEVTKLSLLLKVLEAKTSRALTSS